MISSFMYKIQKLTVINYTVTDFDSPILNSGHFDFALYGFFFSLTDGICIILIKVGLDYMICHQNQTGCWLILHPIQHKLMLSNFI